MKLLSLLIVLGWLSPYAGCSFHSDKHKNVDLTDKEKTLMTKVRIQLKAEEITAHWTDSKDSISKSFTVIITNSHLIKLTNPSLVKTASIIADSVLAVNDYTKKYDTISVVFLEKSGQQSNDKQHFKIFRWGPEKIDIKLAKLTSPEAYLSKRAIEMGNQKNYAAMVALADSMAISNPDIAETCERIKGIASMDMGDTTNALKHYLLARNLQPNDEHNCLNLAYVYMCIGKYKAALPYMDTAMALVSKDERGNIYCTRSRYEHAAGMHEKACDDAHFALEAGYDAAEELVNAYCK